MNRSSCLIPGLLLLALGQARAQDGIVGALEGPGDPVERAREIGSLLEDGPGEEEQAWIARSFQGPPTDATGQVLHALAAAGHLEALCEELDPPLLRRIADHVPSAEVAVELIVALTSDPDDRARRLAAHRVLDRTRALGQLEAVLARLGADPGPGVRELLVAAAPTRRPILFGHRGNPLHQPENTAEALESARGRGATGVEIDLCLTADGQIVLWHDEDPDDPVALVRQLSGESGVSYRPWVPSLTSASRRRVSELPLAELREHHGYARLGPRGRRAAHGIPTLDEVGPLLRGFERVILDLKIPRRRRVVETFGRELAQVLGRHGLTERVVLLSPDERLLRALTPLLPGCATAQDVEIQRLLAGGDHSAVATALAGGHRFASIGRPVLPKLEGAWDYYLSVLRRDRARIDAEGLDLRLLAWTIDDELELREVLAIGVDGVITNRIDLARELLARLGL